MLAQMLEIIFQHFPTLCAHPDSKWLSHFSELAPFAPFVLTKYKNIKLISDY